MSRRVATVGSGKTIAHYPVLYLQSTIINDVTRVHSRLELGRYRFFKSVSVFGFLVGFSKVGIGFGFGFSKYRDIGFGFPHEPTIAYRITPSLTPYALPFPPNGVWALEFALQIAAIRDNDIVTIETFRNTPSLYRTVLSSTRCALPFSQNGEWGPKNLHCDLRPNSNS